jgi:hypothetical protein
MGKAVAGTGRPAAPFFGERLERSCVYAVAVLDGVVGATGTSP